MKKEEQQNSISQLESNLPLFLKVDEAAEVSRVDHKTMYRWAKEGRVKSVRIGGRRLICRDELVRILTEGC